MVCLPVVKAPVGFFPETLAPFEGSMGWAIVGESSVSVPIILAPIWALGFVTRALHGGYYCCGRTHIGGLLFLVPAT